MTTNLRVEQGEECVVGVFDDFSAARDAVLALNQAEFAKERISLVAAGVNERPDVREALQYGDNTTKDAATGAGIGGLLGLVVGGAALTVSGLGPIFAAGYIATTLTGAIAGAVLGAMAGWGVHEDHIAQYEDLIRQGKTLVIYYGNPRETADAERLLQSCRADDVFLHAAAADEGPEVDDRPRRAR